ncbi:MBL fold metallo-hydrolase [bacterium]|nr:MBL fold metallo-hydrolase [bacterium]
MQFGDFELHVLSDGHFKLDGGAMFGVVPKVLWSKLTEPNEYNRIPMGLNCLLIKSTSDLILVDTGIGSNYDEKFANIFEIEQTTDLLGHLARLGHRREDITKVILTHLHFDHCGGNCRKAKNGALEPSFPNAEYYMQQGELSYAKNPDSRSRGSYFAHNWEPLEKAAQVTLISGNHQIVPGVSVEVTGGHTRDHQIFKIVSGGKTACFLADLAPTTAHLKTPYVMGFDLYPATTMQVKERVLQQALAENWLLIFEHDPRISAGYLYETDGKLQVEKIEIA